MKYKYYNLFNLTDFDALSVPYITRTFELEGQGSVEVRLSRGLTYSLYVNGYMLTPGLNDRNPFVSFDQKMAAYIDEDKNIWLGFYED
ncbi:hypothetical protein AAIR98_001321 [Elusimicrobium simillimum]|uniref:hypothetical protein n=1 Tax=Elusimicrobium simillimum TaxID=3143438 RepID=UPI003C6F51E2